MATPDVDTRHHVWCMKIREIRKQAEAERYKEAADPSSSIFKSTTEFGDLPERIQVNILSYLALDMRVTLRRELGTVATGTDEAVAVFLLNSDAWYSYESQLRVSEGFRQRMNEGFEQEIATKRISIILDMRDSKPGPDEPIVNDWYSFAKVGREIDRVPAVYIRQYLALNIISPYHVAGVTKIFAATLIRPKTGQAVKWFTNPTWVTFDGTPSNQVNEVFAAIQWKIQNPFTEGTDFGSFWTPKHLEYFHHVLANIATKNVLPDRGDLPAPANMIETLRIFRILAGVGE